jgi:hypothetical protein
MNNLTGQSQSHNRAAELAKAVLPPGFLYFIQKQKKEMHKMKNLTGTVIPITYAKIDVLLEAKCVAECSPAIIGRLPGIISRLSSTFAIRGAAWLFIRAVSVGETVVLVDKANGYSCRVRREVGAVCVLEIYESIPPETEASVMYLLNWGLLRAVAGEKAVAA